MKNVDFEWVLTKESGQVNLQPRFYQRGFKWSQKQSSL